MKFKLTSAFTAIVLVLCVIACCEASTFKPFVRSRYSLRWRKTTETPKILESTPMASKSLVSVTTIQSITYPESTHNVVVKEGSETTTTGADTAPTTHTTHISETSTHPPDYDYYGNNEVEETEHKTTH